MSTHVIAGNPARNKALGFAKRGFPVIPVWGVEGGTCDCGRPACESPGKHPIGVLVPHGLRDATTDTDIISEWFDEHPNANYGVSTDQLPTIDIDPRNGGDEAWKKLLRGGYEPHTWTVRTGGLGKHIICGGHTQPIPSCKLARGVDLKGVGGYVVGAGSMHASGRRYYFYADCLPKDTPLAPLPMWILHIAAKDNNKGPMSPADLDRLVEDAFEGERNDRLTKLFGHVYGAMRPDRAVLCHLVAAWNDGHCHPPLPHAEVLAIAESILNCERKKREIK